MTSFRILAPSVAARTARGKGRTRGSRGVGILPAAACGMHSGLPRKESPAQKEVYKRTNWMPGGDVEGNTLVRLRMSSCTGPIA